MNKNKLLLIESEMTKAKGHFLDYLIETSNFFSKDNDIIWFLNKNFNSHNSYLPVFCRIQKIIDSNKFRRKQNKILYFFEEFILFILNFYYIFYFFLLFLKKKKLKKFILCLYENFFIIPRYFKSFYLEFLKYGFKKDDNIIFQSCRRKDIALVYFLVNIEGENLPKTHLRVFLPPNKRFKDFYFYLKKIKKFLNKKIFLYTEDGFKKDLISKEINSINLVNTTTPIFNFYSRVPEKNFTIGFIGEARANKGFNLIPEFIRKLNQKNNKIKFLIQFSNTDAQTSHTRNILYNLQNEFDNISIIEKYCDYLEYRNMLKTINLMPFMYDSEHMNNTNSGIVYSCISHEIIPIIPLNSSYLKKILADNSYEEANTVDSYVEKSSIIFSSYENYLNNAKKSSLMLSKTINEGPMVRNIYS